MSCESVLANVESSANFSMPENYNATSFTMVAASVPPKTNYCVGVLRDGCCAFAETVKADNRLGTLHMTPVRTVTSIRPSVEQSALRAAEAVASVVEDDTVHGVCVHFDTLVFIADD